jgi:hypothetical protein
MSFDTQKMKRYAQLSQIFTPGTPVGRRDRFSGRIQQVMEVIGGLAQPGRHVVMFGDRGIGKTSLANVLSEFLEPLGSNTIVKRLNCTTSDKYASIWRRILSNLDVEVPESWSYANPDPDQIRSMLQTLPKPATIILDEYDRVEDDEGLSLMADTLKALSDHAVPTKLIIVGVADSLTQLVGEHESVERALIEVPMYRMTHAELEDIPRTGLKLVDMTISDEAAALVAGLAEGLPFFVHSLMLSASQKVVLDDRDQVETADIDAAIQEAVSSHLLAREYETGIRSPRKDNLYSRVLTACALAQKNQLGDFTAGAVREPMTQLMGKPYDIPAFARHLNAFTETNRGPILKREGTERNYVYRFRNPLMQPYAIMRAISEGVLDRDTRKPRT